MEIRYSGHLKLRLKMRGIPEDMPRIIFLRARKRFLDMATNLEIAVLLTDYLGKRRQVAVAYRKEGNITRLITIHPLKLRQLDNRLRSGRWKAL